MNTQQKRSKKEKLAQRDGCVCRWCGKEFPVNQLTIEHLIPSSKIKNLPGKNSLNNLRLACLECNRNRRDRPFPPGYTPNWNDIGQFSEAFLQLGIEGVK